MTEKLERDYVLEALIKACETKNENIGLTMNLKGVVITGSLVSRKTYMEGMKRELAYLGEEAGTLIANSFYTDRDRQETAQNGGRQILTDYLHLKHAKVVVGSFTIPTDGDFWRIKVSEVDGFSLGAVSFQS